MKTYLAGRLSTTTALLDADKEAGSGGDEKPEASLMDVDGKSPSEESPNPADSKDGEGGNDGEENSSGEKGESDEDAPSPLVATDIVLPEGYEISEESMTGFLTLLNNNDLSKADLAKEMIALQARVSDQASEAAEEAALAQWKSAQEQFQADALKLPGVEGSTEKLNTMLGGIKQGLEAALTTKEGTSTFPVKEVFEALNLTGAGNHPAIIYAFYELTKPFAEGRPVTAAPATDKLTRADRLFGQKGT